MMDLIYPCAINGIEGKLPAANALGESTQQVPQLEEP